MKRMKPTEFDSDIEECPKCKHDLRGESIPKNQQSMYKTGSTHYSKLVGIEIRGGYDGVSYYQCPFCKTMWDRWTGKQLTSESRKEE